MAVPLCRVRLVLAPVAVAGEEEVERVCSTERGRTRCSSQRSTNTSRCCNTSSDNTGCLAPTSAHPPWACTRHNINITFTISSTIQASFTAPSKVLR